MHCFNCKFEITKSFADYHLHFSRNPNEGSAKALWQKEFKKFFPNLKLFDCERCGILSIDHHAINKESLDIYYKEHYTDNWDESSTEYINAYWKARSDGQYNAISHYVNSSTVNNILEYGAGKKALCLRGMGERFPKAKLYAIEISNAVIKDPKICIDQKSIKYDIIIFSHVIEHLLFPQDTIKYLISRMNKNGLLIVDVPNQKKHILHNVALYHRSHLPSYSYSPHITFFSMKNIKKFFNDNFKNLDLLTLKTSGGIDYKLSNSRKIKWHYPKSSIKNKLKKLLLGRFKPIYLFLKFLYNLNKPRYDFMNTHPINYDEDIGVDIRAVLRLNK
jgi:hypothetical protein